MRRTLRILWKSLFLLIGIHSFAQNSPDKGCKPPIGRVLWHDRIDREQKNTLRADGRADAEFRAGNNEELNYYVTLAITKKIDYLQCRIENDTLLGDQKKKSYLQGIEKMLKNFVSFYRSRQFNAAHLPTSFDAYEAAMDLDRKKESIEPVILAGPYDVDRLVLSSDAFTGNSGYAVSRNEMLRKYCSLYPDQIFAKLKDNPDVPFRDSLILLAGYRFPKKLYDFAAADNRLGYAIRSINDPFIQAVSKMARSGGSGQLYFPFLDNLTSGRQSFEEIDAVKNDETKYYQLLVKTRIDYVQRALNGEKVVSMGVLDTMLQRKGRDYFIKEINALHEQTNPAIRFKVLQPLSAQELYYLVIAGERDLYTSSYVQGIYPLMMQKCGNRGDSLLMSVGFDRFKKFLKMAAGYNTLSQFLASFQEKQSAQTLMTAFVNNLEKSEGLEDGVDVADSYASISETIKPVADEMLKNVQLNYDRCVRANNKRGMVIYNLLSKLFQSASDSTIDLSREFGIPPVYNVSYQSLTADSTGKVVMQVFFYGDKDGKMNYGQFTPQFANANWKKVEDTKNWVTFASTKGKPIVIYANKPLDEESGALDEAQKALDNYLADKGIEPTVIIHRGHSYYAGYTIDQIPPSAKIVFLGSCGGYNLIHDVLKHSSDAHIIASKQTGKLNINQPFIDLLNEKLRNGRNIDWIPFWREFKAKAGKIDGFEDYIPPYKNLGAIFIKGYNSAMGEEE